MKNIFFLKIFEKENCLSGRLVFPAGRQEEKGVSLYMTIILMAVLLSMVLGVTAIIINGLNIAKGVTDSVKAFHAADTGIENALYRIRIEELEDSPCSPVCYPWGDSEWSYTFTEYNCNTSTPSISIKSKGVYHGSQRMIEVKY
jgi:Tfp pilus assembly protein PilX